MAGVFGPYRFNIKKNPDEQLEGRHYSSGTYVVFRIPESTQRLQE
jgi:hypothetical protein